MRLKQRIGTLEDLEDGPGLLPEKFVTLDRFQRGLAEFQECVEITLREGKPGNIMQERGIELASTDEVASLRDKVQALEQQHNTVLNGLNKLNVKIQQDQRERKKQEPPVASTSGSTAILANDTPPSLADHYVTALKREMISAVQEVHDQMSTWTTRVSSIEAQLTSLDKWRPNALVHSARSTPTVETSSLPVDNSAQVTQAQTIINIQQQLTTCLGMAA